MDCSPPGCSHPWYTLGNNTGMGLPCPLQRIFPDPGITHSLLHCNQIPHCLSHLRKHKLPKQNELRAKSRHITVEMAKFKDKDRILKAARKNKELVSKGKHSIRLLVDFSAECLNISCNSLLTFKVLKGKSQGTQDSLPSKTIIWNRRRKNFSRQAKLKELKTLKFILKEILKVFFFF